jgi:hypothetical protein
MPSAVSGSVILGRFNLEERSDGYLGITARGDLKMDLDILAGREAVRQIYQRNFDYVVCHSPDLQTLGYYDDHSLTPELRKEHARKELTGRIILCRHWLNRDMYGRDWLNPSELLTPCLLLSAEAKPETAAHLIYTYQLPIDFLPNLERRKLRPFASLSEAEDLIPEYFGLMYRNMLLGPLVLDAAGKNLIVPEDIDLLQITEAANLVYTFDSPMVEQIHIADHRIFDPGANHVEAFRYIRQERLGRWEWFWCPRVKEVPPEIKTFAEAIECVDERYSCFLKEEWEIGLSDGTKIYGPFRKKENSKVGFVPIDLLKTLPSDGLMNFGGHIVLRNDCREQVWKMRTRGPVAPPPEVKPAPAPSVPLPQATPFNPTAAPVVAPQPAAFEHEWELIDHVVNYIAGRRFHFTPEEIIDLHISLKTGGLVILSGTSGTGKSRLAELYAESLGMTSQNNRFLWIPVRPRWTDDDDLLGFYNTRTQRYEPGETGLVELLSKADKEPNSLFVCLFDEMNLARVEHYFSQFLSLLERAPSDRRLTLYSPTFSTICVNCELFPPQIPIGANVLMLGTINVDESTYHLSDKVLDRCNFLRFDDVNLSGWWARRTREPEPISPREITFADWNKLVNHRPSLTPEELGLLERINTLLRQSGMQFGYRVVEQIDGYLANIPIGENEEPLLSRHKALDLQIAHRILPKIRGTFEELRPVLGSMGEGVSYLERELLDSGFFSPGSSASLALIETKKRALELHDHTI